MPSDFKRIFALLAALALRDYNGMLEKGQDWLQTPAKDQILKQDFDSVALSALQLSLAHENRWDDLKLSEKVFGKSIESTGDYNSQRILINSMASQ